jgi:hypothetical protein
MLYIMRKAGNGKGESAYQWHVNQKSPTDDRDEPWENVCEIQADGHELDYIRRNLSGLPDKPNAGFLVWKGELAQFIYDNCLRRPTKYNY